MKPLVTYSHFASIIRLIRSEEWMCQIQYIMSIIIKLYITVHSNIKPPTVTIFPGYKGLIPRKTAGTVYLYMGNILLEASH